MGVGPYAALIVVWWIKYHQWGFGTYGSGAYIDPGQNPWEYLCALFMRIPILLNGQWLCPDASVFSLIPQRLAHGVLIGIYSLLTGIAILLTPLLKQNRVARFWALGMVLSLLPICAGFPDNRLLIFVGLGAMGLLAQFLCAWYEKAAWWPTSRAWQISAKVFAIVFIVLHLVAAPLLLPFKAQTIALYSKTMIEQPIVKLTLSQDMIGKTMVFINPPSAEITGFIHKTCLEYKLFPPDKSRVLATGLTSDLDIRRVDSNALEIEPRYGFITQDMERLYRGSAHPMGVGQKVVLSDMQAEVLSLTEDRRPLRVRFSFLHPLEDDALSFFIWKDRDFVPFKPPQVGDSVHLERISTTRLLYHSLTSATDG
jgi:hypothetical protein